MRIVVDAYAWVELFLGSEKGNKVREILAEAREVYTPGVVMAEVARKYLREGAGEQTVLERLKTITEASETAPIGIEIALESAKCYAELSERARRVGARTPSLFDAIVLATARVLEAKVVTGDEHLKNLPETLWTG